MGNAEELPLPLVFLSSFFAVSTVNAFLCVLGCFAGRLSLGSAFCKHLSILHADTAGHTWSMISPLQHQVQPIK